ncbi:MAG: phosphoribosylglycinamide formyltransferase [Pseudomonadaceae bacterium]|nr:phosphoribosylglycinamide formyltransferase [Pseudomonadaceae bacterium]
MMRLAVLASHAGTTLQAILDAIEARQLAAEVNLVISNNSNSGALARARNAGIETAHLSQARCGDTLDADIAQRLQDSGCDYVVLAGYMKRLGPQTLERFNERIINTHPSLLPRHGGQGMFGRRVHEAVLAAGDTETGASVHFVTGDYDTGPLLAQRTVDVLPGDTADDIEAKVRAVERPLLIETLNALAQELRDASDDAQANQA